MEYNINDCQFWHDLLSERSLEDKDAEKMLSLLLESLDLYPIPKSYNLYWILEKDMSFDTMDPS